MARVAKHSSDPSQKETAVGTYLGYDRTGKLIYTGENFVVGVDKIPPGLSEGLAAMKVVNPKTGEFVASWDPWDVLKGPAPKPAAPPAIPVPEGGLDDEG